MLANPQTYFAELPDPRRQTRNKPHKLEDIVMITLCAVVCGFEDWVSIEDFGCENEPWLRGFLELPHGIPSHDTLSDVMGRIDRQAFARAFGEWMQQSLPALAGQQVELDGKSLRGSRDGQQLPVHLMSAFATQARLVLGVQAVADKSNEIHAIPDLLAQVELAGAVVTIDAMGCQKSVAQAIVKKKADSVLALKDNHPILREEVASWLDYCKRPANLSITHNSDTNPRSQDNVVQLGQASPDKGIDRSHRSRGPWQIPSQSTAISCERTKKTGVSTERSRARSCPWLSSQQPSSERTVGTVRRTLPKVPATKFLWRLAVILKVYWTSTRSEVVSRPI